MQNYKTQPTEPGWYWVYKNQKWEVVEVAKINIEGVDRLLVSCEAMFEHVEDYHFWVGPLSTPDKPKD